MHPTPRRFALGDGFDAAAVFAARYAGRDDVFWLDSGADGVSYLGEGTRLDAGAATIWTALWECSRIAEQSDLPGFALGAVGWLGYELRGTTTGASVTRASRYPDAAFLSVTSAIAIDARTGAGELLVLDSVPEAELETLRAAVSALRGAQPPEPRPAAHTGPAHWHETDADYLAGVAACQTAIRDGEAYQLCLTTEAEVAGEFDAFEVYLRLRATSPTHHGGLLRIGCVALLSSSPERFLEIDPNGRVSTKPIKGTRPRASDPDEDDRLAAELRSSDKERAENLMIVDLMRNDLARVCELGSIAVTELLVVESYAQVHQLVSTVTGQLEPGRSPIDAIEACFPAGSMTGAPKRRATELLDRLEGRARGLYAGAFGYVGFDGRVDLAMTIRTVVLDARGATIGTGGGITALSVPEEELAEAKLKARALLAALGSE